MREHGVVDAVQRKAAAIKVQHRLGVTVEQSVFCAMKNGICDRVCRSLGGIRVIFFVKGEVHVKQLQYGTVAATGKKVQFADGNEWYWACCKWTSFAVSGVSVDLEMLTVYSAT